MSNQFDAPGEVITCLPESIPSESKSFLRSSFRFHKRNNSLPTKHTESGISVKRGLLWDYQVRCPRLLCAREISETVLSKAVYHHGKKCIWVVDAFCTKFGFVARHPLVALRGLSAHPLVLLQHLAVIRRGTPPRAASCFPKS